MAKHRIQKPRAIAIARGAASYLSGKPCKNGHVSERNIRGHCVECVKKANRREMAGDIPVMKSQRTKTGFVYVVSATNGYVKIGKASNPFERFTMIQCNSPLPVTLSYVCQCANPVDIEEAAHHALHTYRRHREWFDVSTEKAIDAVRSALRGAGAEPIAAPHRAAKSNGAQIIHRPEINEAAFAFPA